LSTCFQFFGVYTYERNCWLTWQLYVQQTGFQSNCNSFLTPVCILVVNFCTTYLACLLFDLNYACWLQLSDIDWALDSWYANFFPKVSDTTHIKRTLSSASLAPMVHLLQSINFPKLTFGFILGVVRSMGLTNE
jgi:hypothetical protein